MPYSRVRITAPLLLDRHDNFIPKHYTQIKKTPRTKHAVLRTSRAHFIRTPEIDVIIVEVKTLSPITFTITPGGHSQSSHT
ncbi:hypothetical protein [Candidatus Clavichlamydia salmonicola]|uniref:hypothetical protein n=1 Tax=Candidatus Clavichlamydia salmonicola TaxID=469812 RepID=UPI0018917F65|nr:hypothetical protein [Candidatus Clavichlamydia salmonicola]